MKTTKPLKIRELARTISASAENFPAASEARQVITRCAAGIVSRAHELEHLLSHIESKVNGALADNANGSPRNARLVLLSLLSDI